MDDICVPDTYVPCNLRSSSIAVLPSVLGPVVPDCADVAVPPAAPVDRPLVFLANQLGFPKLVPNAAKPLTTPSFGGLTAPVPDPDPDPDPIPTPTALAGASPSTALPARGDPSIEGLLCSEGVNDAVELVLRTTLRWNSPKGELLSFDVLMAMAGAAVAEGGTGSPFGYEPAEEATEAVRPNDEGAKIGVSREGGEAGEALEGTRRGEGTTCCVEARRAGPGATSTS